MMMSTPLTLTPLLERAEKYFSKKYVISKTSSGIHRFTYQEIGERTRALASMLVKLGIQKGDRVGTLAWNDHRHLEAYFAAPCIGAVLHTINVRLSSDHLTYIINHSEDKVLIIDSTFVPLIEHVKDELKSVQAFIIMSDAKTLPQTSLHPVYSYEELIADGNKHYQFPDNIDENDPAGMCYTSATTGKPKGVVYTHRSTVLHCIALGLKDTLAISEEDVCLPVVPMFHVNAWGIPFACTYFGSNQALPGPDLTPTSLASLIQSEKVTLAAGVPTVWLGLAKELEQNHYDTSSLRAVVCGGSAAPKGLIRQYEEKLGIPFIHAYGATETSPLVSVARLKSYQQDLSEDEKFNIRATQGMIVPGLELRVVSDNSEVAHNGKEMGELLLRGPWIADEYYRDDRGKEAFKNGWLHTGDIVTIDEEGNLKIVDRTKDLVKSGGEWISSVDLENALMAHEAIFEAAVVAVPHPKWQERPVACVVLKEGYKNTVTKEDILDFLRLQFAKWWIPDDVIFINEIPKSSVGKFLKRELRERLKNHLIAQD